MKCITAALEDLSALLLQEKIILQKEQREKNQELLPLEQPALNMRQVLATS